MRRAASTLICSSLVAGIGTYPALAQAGSDPANGHSPLYYLLQALVSLAVVIGIIYLIYFGLRRLSQTRAVGKGDILRVLESRHLGGGRWVYVLEVADRILVVGGGNEGLRTLAELPRDQFLESEQRGVTGDETTG